MVWWLLPLLATLAAWAWTRRAGYRRGRLRPRPEPGTAEDAADLKRFAAALASPMPDRRP